MNKRAMLELFSKKTLKNNCTPKKIQKNVIACFVGFVAMTIPMLAFAADGTLISNAIVKVCNDLGGLMTTILVPICALMLGFNILKIIFGSSQKSTESALRTIKTIIICFIIFNCLGLILIYGQDMLESINGMYQSWGGK